MRRTSVLRMLATGVVAAATGVTLLAAPAWADDTATAQPTEPVAVAPAMTQGLDRTARQGTPAEAARAHIKDHKDTYKVPVSDLKTLSTTKEGEQSSVRFQQQHDGVPVFGAEYAVQTEAADGGRQVTSATGTLYTDLTVSTTPKVAEATAKQRMFTLDRGLSGVRGAKTEAHGLSVLPDAHGGRLAWHFTVTGAKADGGPVRQEVYVDARVGGIALSYNNIDAADASPAQGTGVRVDGGEAKLDLNKEPDGSYTLVDSTRAMYPRTGGQIRTYDANRKQYTDVAGGPVTDDIPLSTSASDRFDGANTSSGAVDAHLNAAKVYEFYKNRIGRDGIDGKGGTIHSVVNVAANGKDYANAFWDGSKMVYGHMDGVPLSVGLDVVGHEMTHGVTEHSAGLVYLNQSGALNEAISDYFGNAMETADKGVAMSDPKSGLIGEYLCNGTKPLEECALRDLNDGRNAQKDYEPITLDIDNGGVHYNSTIVGGALWDIRKNLDTELADRIIYRSAQNYLTPLSGFTDMRNAVTLAAKSLKVSKADLATIAKAFDDHGIEAGWEKKGGTHDGTTIGADVLPAYEVYSGVDEQAAQINGDVYAISHGDAIAWDQGSAAFGITVGRFGKKPVHEVAQKDAYLLDPSLDDDRIVFTRITADGIGIYRTGAKGQGAIKKLVDLPGADETEPVTDNGALAYISTTPDGEQDVMLRKADGTTVNVTPEAGTKAARLAMKHGRIAWAGVDGTWVTVYDIAKGTTQTKRISGFLFNYISDIQITSDRVFWRETGGFLVPSSKFVSAPLDDLSKAATLRYPSSTYLAQFSVNDEYFAYSTYDFWGALGSWSGPGKAMVAKTADVIAGADDYSRISCSSGAQLAPSLGDGQRVAWLDTTAAATDVVTRETFARTCE
ncbi:M4 family metallopeptidase [Streptomyces sp. NBC_00257]|uniref:M4 family metallopeptidase n=1 Tax=unclassified Streptomyces TaxID=2593676 RepID=UPI00224D96A8|nr:MULTISPECIES: M4 family metallopeptidase [unclassified Streptomyces]WTB58371.1 M4 family metallopeptidase [Streptomyces sp. NBC_00826]WTH88749.1 M4 family metallopeptidase [Streptomyces sp. NBC_00825]WTH97479.1 M4 family metallopeptidase [Streptomyces sp. NBC_00822]MCX4862997.1 M4 family metallopeptidase [Streptomyces sp. NBC_00906]MCX4894234.1 M4 family metallopeptidase [Streptomyces sp. NBC_00892]